MRILRLFFLMIAATGGFACPVRAGSFEVAPTTITLNDSSPAVFYITNHSAEPIVAQVEGYAWCQTDKDQLDDTDDLIISPPMMRLLPNQQQTIRLMAKPGGDAGRERTFRLIVSEIPDPSSQTDRDKVRMLLQFSVPVFAGDIKKTDAPLQWEASIQPDGLALKAQNTGQQHAKISSLLLETDSGQKMSVDEGKLRYILAGASSRWTIPQPVVTSGQTVHLKALDEITGKTIDTPLHIK